MLGLFSSRVAGTSSSGRSRITDDEMGKSRVMVYDQRSAYRSGNKHDPDWCCCIRSPRC